MEQDQYAIITGASSGIGWELARTFAAHNTHLVVVARSEEKLMALAASLRESLGVDTHILVKDLGRYESSAEIFRYCQQHRLPVRYLVNNAGIGHFGPFAEAAWEKQQQMINLNMMALTHLTHLFLPGMISAGYGRIMNVASTAAFQPGPTMAVYFASKAYVLHFSEAIGNELQGTGVTVTALCPGATESGFKDAAAMEQSRLFKGKKLPASAAVAAYGYKAMMQGKAVAIHGFKNYILATSVRLVPRGMMTRLARLITE